MSTGRRGRSRAPTTSNAFSARYGQAVSGLINVVTRDPADQWQSRFAYETDRPLWNGWDYGIDRAVGAPGSGYRLEARAA